MELDQRFVYTGNRTKEISFPLGGIGTGCIGLAGNGRLVDWEIANHPNKGSVNGMSHFAIRAEKDGEVIDARVLNSDLHPPYSGNYHGNRFNSFGFGPPREYLTGVPHFRDVIFKAAYPIAELAFVDDSFPGKVSMMAFNPFIPLNDRDSGLPVAMFEISVENPTDAPMRYTIAASLANPFPGNNQNEQKQAGDIHWLNLRSDGLEPTATDYGMLTLAAQGDDASVQEYWYRGRWFDALEVYWQDFNTVGAIKPRRYVGDAAGEENTATIALHVDAAPGETVSRRFVIAWHYPNRVNDWNPNACKCDTCDVKAQWKNYYAILFGDAEDSARYALSHWDRLYAETRLFQETLLNSSLPEAALDAISANLSILKSPTVMRLEDGTFYGFEGCHPDSGCCEGSCTHVWNYAQALPFLFPALERSMRDADYKYNQLPDGGMPFRIQLPLGSPPSAFRPCADGQFGDVLKVYRDWKIYGDTEWLRNLWPAVKKSIEFTWSPHNADSWDPDKTGVLQGRQHHTLDMELFGPNSWLTGFYLGALKAAAEMALALGEDKDAAEFQRIFKRGKTWADEHLFNGEYYQQNVDLNDDSILEPYSQGAGSMVGSVKQSYWSDEHAQLKYQVGDGCGIDQVLAQWHADLYGLGDIFDAAQVKSSLTAMYKHNFKNPLREHFNPCRIFGLNDEAGLVICDWPAGTERPVFPITYSQEAMHGFEYAAAIHMIIVGLVEQGMAVVEAVRDRYDGEKRNPWNEFECGSNYARSMASYALLNAFSGFSFDMPNGMLGFNPKMKGGTFQSLWSLDCAWGQVRITPNMVILEVMQGRLELKELRLPFTRNRIHDVTQFDESVSFRRGLGALHFDQGVTVLPGQSLVVALG